MDTSTDGITLKQNIQRHRKEPGHLPKDLLRHFAYNRHPMGYANINRTETKSTSYSNGNQHQGTLERQTKAKAITIIKLGPETPKFFVKVLLNQRNIKSYESLISDIEESFQNQSQSSLGKVCNIYNLFGKKMKTATEFFKSDDIFIATCNDEYLKIMQVKEILDELYPNNPQTDSILRHWDLEKLKYDYKKEKLEKQSKLPKIFNTEEKRNNLMNGNEFLNEMENLDNQNHSTLRKSNKSSKLKSLKTKIFKRARRVGHKSKAIGNVFPKIDETHMVAMDKITGQYSPDSYKKMMQERNAERLRAAYEDRERARVLIQEQLNAERMKIENHSISNSDTYSQYVKKFITNNGSISVFKKMDDAKIEIRKNKMRKHLYNENNQSKPNLNAIDENAVDRRNRDKRVEKESQNTDEERKHQSPVVIHSENVLPNVLRNLNKIGETYHTVGAPASNDLNFINDQSEDIKRTMKHSLNNDKINQIIHGTEVLSKDQKRPFKFQSHDGDLTINKENDVVERRLDDNQNSSNSNNPKLHSTKNETHLHASANRNSTSSPYQTQNLPKLKEVDSDIEVVKELPTHVNQSKPENVRTLRQENSPSPTQNKTVSHKLPLPGKRILGKWCRQISSPEILHQRFEISKILGDGNFAIVKTAIRKDNSREYAIKVIDKSKMFGKEYMIENEIWIMKLCNHDNIIKLKEEYESKEEVFLVMELIKGGDLFDAITKSIKFSETIASKMVTDMASALFYLHSRQIVHRDLKPENVMILRHRDGNITLKLADFGLAAEVKNLLFTICGTATYVAPEILSETGYSIEVDLWALGVITYILLCGFAPFQCPNNNQEQLFIIIQSGRFQFVSPYWDKISKDVKDLISNLLEVDRRRRFTTIQVLSHKWIMSRGLSNDDSDQIRLTRAKELEEEAKLHLESFQRKKNDLRKSIGRNI